MRLINTKTLGIESFPRFEHPTIPAYVILSHRWGADEVSLQEMQDPSPSLPSKLGYQKVLKCCEVAGSFGFEYVWIDTCCIDKTNNVELTEAINSMFNYYRDADVCYAYLVDVPSDDQLEAEESRFRKSSWFTRGWTLQELLGPETVIFYGNDWKEIGTKSSLPEIISGITSISSEALKWYDKSRSKFSVAQKMAWASKRETERVEDMAYCLLGLFAVNMPMIYGEGQNAFKRLQLEIMKESCDQSIFAWTAQRPNNRHLGPRSQRGLLAYSPAEFERAHHVVQSGVSRTEFSMTNMGMKIKLPVLTSSHCHMPKGSREKVVVAVLNCQDGPGSQIGIFLKSTNVGYTRIHPDQIELVDLQQIIEHGGTKIEFYVPQTTPPAKGSLSPYQWLVLFLRRSPRPTKPSAHRTAGSDYLVPWQMGKIDATVKVDGSDCSGGAMVFSNSVGYMFGVYVNIHEQSFFYDIRFDLGLEDLDCMEKGHWRKEGIPMSPQSDRRSFPLKGEQMLNFAVRPGLVDGAKAQFVEVSPGGDFQLKQFVPGLLFAP